MSVTETSALEDLFRAPGVGARLVALDGPCSGAAVRLAETAVIVGSADECDLVLSDPSVSRRHVRVEKEARGFLVTDLGSKNGTFYLGSQVQTAIVSEGAVLRVGRAILQVQPGERSPEIAPSTHHAFGPLLGRSLCMRRVFTILERVAPTLVTVLIEGPSGTGKELVARALHERGPTPSGPFVVFDCGAVPATLIESELFGHVRGAFTGAVSDRPGAFERAHGGTLFLDELGELPLELQPRLLRALESREVQRVGATSGKKVVVRVLAATNRAVEREVAAGRFREDLYYRLCVVQVHLPPLRERLDDIPFLATQILKRAGLEMEDELGGENLDMLLAHEWRGNVRELRNVLERAVVLSPGAHRFADLRLDLAPAAPGGSLAVRTDLGFHDAKARVMAEFERAYLAATLEAEKGNISRAARRAGVDRNHLKTLLRRHGLL